MNRAYSHVRATSGISIHFSSHKARPKRDPYDGLRLWSAITHGFGAALAILGTILLLVRSAASPVHFYSFAVYGLSMVGLYTASTLYHSINTTVQGRLALRKYDHCSIYLLIAGSYTPICLTALNGLTGLALVSVIWALVAVTSTLVRI